VRRTDRVRQYPDAHQAAIAALGNGHARERVLVRPDAHKRAFARSYVVGGMVGIAAFTIFLAVVLFLGWIL
jgi:hypothetical protein